MDTNGIRHSGKVRNTCYAKHRGIVQDLVIFGKREGREQSARGPDQLGGQSLSANDRLAHVIACKKAKDGDGRAVDTQCR